MAKRKVSTIVRATPTEQKKQNCTTLYQINQITDLKKIRNYAKN